MCIIAKREDTPNKVKAVMFSLEEADILNRYIDNMKK